MKGRVGCKYLNARVCVRQIPRRSPLLVFDFASSLSSVFQTPVTEPTCRQNPRLNDNLPAPLSARLRGRREFHGDSRIQGSSRASQCTHDECRSASMEGELVRRTNSLACYNLPYAISHLVTGRRSAGRWQSIAVMEWALFLWKCVGGREGWSIPELQSTVTSLLDVQQVAVARAP